MEHLQPNETMVEGSWQIDADNIRADASCNRIAWLIDNSLTKIGKDESGWEALYQDSRDGRFWVLIYPNSEMHGGGPPTLRYISNIEAKAKFNV